MRGFAKNNAVSAVTPVIGVMAVVILWSVSLLGAATQCHGNPSQQSTAHPEVVASADSPAGDRAAEGARVHHSSWRAVTPRPECRPASDQLWIGDRAVSRTRSWTQDSVRPWVRSKQSVTDLRSSNARGLVAQPGTLNRSWEPISISSPAQAPLGPRRSVVLRL
jgi:hypothetical protein